MSVFEKYACLYEDQRFSKDERAEIGEFVAGLMKCAATGDQKAMDDLVNRHFAYADRETMEKIGRVMFYISKYGEDHQREALSGIVKEAAGFLSSIRNAAKALTSAPKPTFGQRMSGGASKGWGWFKSNVGPIMEATVLTSLAAPVVAGAIKTVRESGDLKKSLTQIMKAHPELRHDPNTGHYFQLLTTFSPSVATNPLVAGNLMKRFHETGPSLITPSVIKELLGIQQTQAGIDQPFKQDIKNLSDAMLKVAPKGKGPVKVQIDRLPDIIHRGRIQTS